jgi:ABC-type phosphate/phosphonate transport system substrate-binding protein
VTMGLCIKRYPASIAGTLALAALAVGSLHGSSAMAESSPFHLNIGFSSKAFVSVPKDDMRIALQVLTQKVARKTVGSAGSRIYDSSADFEKDLKLKKIDVLALGPDEFIFLRAHMPIEPVMVTVGGKSPEVELFLLARKESGLNSVSDLKRRTVALPSKTAQYGITYYTWVETLVMKEGAKSAGDFFSSLLETRSASQAVMTVFFRKADACVVTKQAFEVASELNPQIARELKVVASISRLAGGVIAFRQDLPDERKQKVLQALETLHEDQEGHQIFVLFQLSRLAPFRPEYLKGYEALYAEHRNLKARMVRR